MKKNIYQKSLLYLSILFILSQFSYSKDIGDIEREILQLNSSLRIADKIYRGSLDALKNYNENMGISKNDLELDIEDNLFYLNKVKEKRKNLLEEWKILKKELGNNYTGLIFSENDLEEEKKLKILKLVKLNNVEDIYKAFGNKNNENGIGKLIRSLRKIKRETPYIYSGELIRKSLENFEEDISFFPEEIQEKKWRGKGQKFSYSGKENVNNFYGDNNYSLNGAMGIIEYGIDKNNSVGMILGGNKGKFKSMGSINMNSSYMGYFLRHNLKNMEFKTEIAYEFSELRGERENIISNNYKGNSFKGTIEGKYFFNREKELAFVPYGRLSYLYIKQDEIKEKPLENNPILNIKQSTEKYLEGSLGLNLIKTSYFKNGILKNAFGGELKTILNKRIDPLKGEFVEKNKSSSSFYFENREISTVKESLKYHIDYEQKNGIIYGCGLIYEFSSISKKNYKVDFNLGYKF
ncbi:MAG: autotransporter outer membrane beta-barrel domain-containing protein [Cetobacterium sp.]|nr:autotransporter outer membrane beta-barrel domain-containing protein [Cetobacterium sp.]